MKKQRHFGTANGIAERETAAIAAMMDDCDVASEKNARGFSIDRTPSIRSWRGRWPPGEIISN